MQTLSTVSAVVARAYKTDASTGWRLHDYRVEVVLMSAAQLFLRCISAALD